MQHDASTGRGMVLTLLVFVEAQWKLRVCMPVRREVRKGLRKLSLVPFHLKERGDILRD